MSRLPVFNANINTNNEVYFLLFLKLHISAEIEQKYRAKTRKKKTSNQIFFLKQNFSNPLFLISVPAAEVSFHCISAAYFLNNSVFKLKVFVFILLLFHLFNILKFAAH